MKTKDLAGYISFYYQKYKKNEFHGCKVQIMIYNNKPSTCNICRYNPYCFYNIVRVVK